MKQRDEKNTSGMEPIPPGLVAQAQAGDQAAFAELYERTSAMLYRTIHSMVRDEDLVWDIQQDSYIQAWQKLSELQTPEAFLPWLRRIAVNTTLNTLNKRVPLTFTDLINSEDEDAPGAELPDLSIDAQPELALDRKETARLVREILKTLPEEQQLIVGMRYYEDMPIKEIADALHVTLGTVKAQLFKGRKKVEAGVLALEKQGVKLYGLSPLPFLLALLRRLEPAAEAEKKALTAVLAQAPAAGAAAGGAAGGTAVTVSAMTASQAFLHGLGAKLLAGVLAAALLIGGGKLAYDALNRGNEIPIGTEQPAVTETAGPGESEAPTDSRQDLPDESAEFPGITEASATAEATEPTEPETLSGVCGKNLTWTFDPDTGVLTIEGSGAMEDYTGVTPWLFFRDQITSISFPEGLTTIGSYAFDDTYGITSLTFPDSLVSIGSTAFNNCTGLRSVSFPEGLSEIGDGAFSSCTSLVSVVLPNGLAVLGRSAFSACKSLYELSLPVALEAVPPLAFRQCSNLRSVVIPEHVTEIGEWAFTECINLSTVSLPDGLTAIRSYAFRDCQSLESVLVPESVTLIEEFAFSDCTALQTLVILNANCTLEDFFVDRSNTLTIRGVPGSEAERYANEKGIPFLPLEETGNASASLPFLSEADSDWETMDIRNDNWIDRALSFYTDGSLWYREGTPFSDYNRSLDGLWQAEDDGSLLLTLWESSYPARERPNGYRVTAADVPAGSWTARFSCTIAGNKLTLQQQTEPGFSAADRTGKWIELYAPEQDPTNIDLQGIRDLQAAIQAEKESLQSESTWVQEGCGGRLQFRGIARVGERYLARLAYSQALTISEAELTQARRTGRITLQGIDYAFVDADEMLEHYPYDEAIGQYGTICQIREDGSVNWYYSWYRVEKVGDRYCFVHGVGGLTSRIETVAATYLLWVDPETKYILGPSEYEDAPTTLAESGSVPVGALSYPGFDPDTGKLFIYVDAR